MSRTLRNPSSAAQGPFRIQREAELHRAIVETLRKAARGDVIWFHCPNGEHRNAVTGARLKALGVRAGVADLCFVLPGGRAAFLELKRGNGRLSRYQHAFAAACERAGALHAVASTIDDALACLRGWGVLSTSRCGGRGAGEGEAAASPEPDRAEVSGAPA